MSVCKLSELPTLTGTPDGAFVFGVSGGELVKIPATEGIAAQGLLQTVKRFTGSKIPLENGIAWYHYDSPVNAELSPEMAPVSIQAGSLAIFSVTYNITASGSIVWPSTVTWEGGVVPGIQNETATFTFISRDGIHWHGNKSISTGG